MRERTGEKTQLRLRNNVSEAFVYLLMLSKSFTKQREKKNMLEKVIIKKNQVHKSADIQDTILDHQTCLILTI